MKRLIAACVIVLSTMTAGDCSNKTHYSNCEEMRKDGAAPVSQGEVNYDPALDADGDGMACE